jgi:hypothetical protein
MVSQVLVPVPGTRYGTTVVPGRVERDLHCSIGGVGGLLISEFYTGVPVCIVAVC